MSREFIAGPGFLVRCSVLTVSDTRDELSDRSGRVIIDLLSTAGHILVTRSLVQDDYGQIQQAIQACVEAGESDALLINGGTGIALRDQTFEAVRDLLDKEMPGFGELLRYISFTEDIGTPAMLSRAIAGVYHGVAVFAMPGSTPAVTLAMQRLVLPELAHVVKEIRKDGHPS